MSLAILQGEQVLYEDFDIVEYILMDRGIRLGFGHNSSLKKRIYSLDKV